MSYAIFCDFDGTITLQDVGKTLLSKFSNDDWKYFDKLVIEGTIGTREALENQWGNLHVSEEEIFSIVEKIEIDSSFSTFLHWVNSLNIPFTIVSDGFIEYVTKILEKAGINHHELNIKANSMSFKNRKIQLTFLTDECSHGCANCKYSHVLKYKEKGYRIIYIGDGLSDILPARELAEFIFAKKGGDLALKLSNDPRLIEFTNFNEIREKIEKEILN